MQLKYLSKDHAGELRIDWGGPWGILSRYSSFGLALGFLKVPLHSLVDTWEEGPDRGGAWVRMCHLVVTSQPHDEPRSFRDSRRIRLALTIANHMTLPSGSFF